MFQSALFIAGFDLKQLFKQRETLMWTFLMPVLFFYFIGTVTGGGNMGAPTDKPSPIALLLPYEPQPDDFLVDSLAERLTAHNFSVQITGTIDANTPNRRLVLPELPEAHSDWTGALLEGEVMEPRLHETRRGSGAMFDEVRASQALYSLLLDMIVLKREGAAINLANMQELSGRPRALTIDQRTAGERPTPPQGYAQTIPGTMVMFTMMILLTGGATLLVTERRAGLLRRLAAAPVHPGSVILGKWLARMGLAVVQLTFSMLLGQWLFHMDWGSSLAAVCLLLLLWAAFNASLSLLLATLARTEGQVSGIAVLGTMLLAALGGCWWPIEVAPAWMQSLAGFLPTGWAMDAMHQLVHFGHGISSAANSMVLLALSSLALAFIATRRFRFE